MTRPKAAPMIIFVLGIVGIVIWSFGGMKYSNAPSLEINRYQAVNLAVGYLAENGIVVSKDAIITAKLLSKEQQFIQKAIFVWQNDGISFFNQIRNRYIYLTGWVIDVKDKDLQHRIILNNRGNPIQIKFALPGLPKVANLTQTQAVAIALDSIRVRYKTNSIGIEVLKAESTKLTDYTQWNIVFQDSRYNLASKTKLLINAQICGDVLTDLHRDIFISPVWIQQYNKQTHKLFVFKIAVFILLMLFALYGVILGIKGWLSHQFVNSTFLYSFIAVFVIIVVTKLLNIPADVNHMMLDKPLFKQWLPEALMELLAGLVISASVGLVLGYFKAWKKCRAITDIQSNVWSALGLAGILIGVHTQLLRFFPQNIPYLPNMSYAEPFFPFLYFALQMLLCYLIALSCSKILYHILHSMTLDWYRNRLIGSLVVILITTLIAGLYLTFRLNWHSLIPVLLYGFSVGAVLIAGYVFIFRYDYRMIALTIFCVQIALISDIAYIHPYPDVIKGSVIAGITLMVTMLLSIYNDKT